MGAVNVSGSFVCIEGDYIKSMQQQQENDEEEYGRRDGYSGASNCVRFCYAGDESSLTKKQLNKLICKRLEEMNKRQGEIIKTKDCGYVVFTPTFESINPRSYLYEVEKFKRPAALVYEAPGSFDCKLISEGTIAEMKKKALEYGHKKNYDGYLYIITKNKKTTYELKKNRKEVKKTSLKTTEKRLVQKLAKYVWYGVAPE